MAEDQSQDWFNNFSISFQSTHLHNSEIDLNKLGNAEELNKLEEKSTHCFLDKPSTLSTCSSSLPQTSEIFTKVELFWKNLSYSITFRKIKKLAKFPWISCRKSEKIILKVQSGFLKSGTFTAVLGPSGAGKSTLLECLSGQKRVNLKGDVFVRVTDTFNHSKETNTNETKIPTVAFIGQKDNLIGVLTIRESLTYAAKLKILDNKLGSISKEHWTDFNLDHKSNSETIINDILIELGLENCADIRVSKCSGGQAKRLSFALELISKPKILILDEPFSGLDSSSAFQCVKLLKRLTSPNGQRSSPLGIIASVHQPSARLLYTFEYLYILSNNGQCLYQGLASDLISYFAQLDLKCPQFHNPADFVIEIASGEYGELRLQTICDKERKRQLSFPFANKKQEREEQIQMSTIVDRMTNQKFPKLLHTWILLQRTWVSTRREHLLTWLRLFQHIFVALIASFMYTEPIGAPNGCFIDFIETFSIHNTTAPSMEKIQKGFLNQFAKTSENVTLMFFISLFIVFANTMPTVLTFPLEMSNYLKERRNAWYGSGTFYIAKFLADAPFQIFIPIILCSILYFATNQIRSIWRFSMFCLIMIILASISQSVGILVSIIFVDNMSAAVFMACLCLMPFFLVGGFFNGHSQDSIIFTPIVILSFVRYSFFALLVVIYGLGRCSLENNQSKELTLSPSIASSSDGVSDLFCLLGCSKNSNSLSMLKMMKSYNITSNDSDWISSFLGVDSNCLKSVINSFEEISGSNLQSLNSSNNQSLTVVSNLNQSSSSTSYILTHYDITDDILWHNILILIAFLVVLRFVAYLWLLYKTNKKLRE